MQEQVDPKGLDQHAPGAKLDGNKIRPELVFRGFANALKAVAEVATYGANKYSEDGWQHVENGGQRYTDALYRHLLEDHLGTRRDDESQLLHLAHAAWNALAILELHLQELQQEIPLLADMIADKENLDDISRARLHRALED